MTFRAAGLQANVVGGDGALDHHEKWTSSPRVAREHANPPLSSS